MLGAPTITSSSKADVFVSYARNNLVQVCELVRALESQGVTIWRDGDRILGGQYYGEQIAHALAHSRVVLVMCSPEAFASDNVHRELLLTWDFYHRNYLPVWLGKPMEIPQRFRYCLAGCQWLAAENLQLAVPEILAALENMGVTTHRRTTNGISPDRSTQGQVRRGPRFKPGDRPIVGLDWELTELLGKGGFGEVWKAVNPELPSQAPVALKFALNLDDMGKKILKHEAAMILRVQQVLKTDGIVPLIHAYLNNDPPCLEYPYYAGSTLVRVIEGRRQNPDSMPVSKVNAIVHRIAHVVGKFHRAEQAVVHRDLKPSNILTRRNPDGKLSIHVTDFGIGRVTSEAALAQSRSGNTGEASMAAVLTGAYTPLYSSPQQSRGQAPDPRDDVYSLGVIWHQLLTGDVSSPAPTGRKWMDSLRTRGVSCEIVDILATCLEADSADRPADCAALASELTKLQTATKTPHRLPDEAIIEAEVVGKALLLEPAPGTQDKTSTERLSRGVDAVAQWLKSASSEVQPAQTIPTGLSQTIRSTHPLGVPAGESIDAANQPRTISEHLRSLILGGSKLRSRYPKWPWVLLGGYLCFITAVVLLSLLAGFKATESMDVVTFLGIAFGTVIFTVALCFVPFRVLTGRSVSRVTLVPGILASASIFAILTAACLSAIVMAFQSATKSTSDGSFDIIFYLLIAFSWLGWLVAFGWRAYNNPTAQVGITLHRALLKSTAIEGVVIILAHLIDRRSDDCFAGIGTMGAMVVSYALALIALGPVLILLVVSRCLEVRTPEQSAVVQRPRLHPIWYVIIGISIVLLLGAFLT